MNRKILITLLSTAIATLGVFVLVLHLFHQEVPQNTIRILVDKAMDERHIRLLPLLQENKYRYQQIENDIELTPVDSAMPKLQFKLVKDENTRALLFLKGEADVLYDSLSIAKTEWLKKQKTDNGIQIFSSLGESISKLAFNIESPSLKNSETRIAIIKALPIKLWSERIFFNWVEPLSVEHTDQKASNLSLRYLTTSSREGQQLAYLVREALEKIGAKVEIQIYEPSLFYLKIRKKEFDLFSSTTLPGMKNILDLPHIEPISLFRWKHGLILSDRVKAPSHIETKLDYSFRFLSELKLSSSP